MSGVRPQHLQRRGGTYHLRVRVPDDVRARVGVLEVRRSLHVHRLPEARHLALKYAARLMEVFAMTRTHALTKDQTRELVVTCFADLTRAADHPFVPSSDRPDMEIEEQQCIAATRSAEWTEQVQTGQFDGIVRNHADRVLQTGNMRLHDLSERLQQDVLEGTARALMEQQRLFVFRLNDRLTPYRPTDPLFAGVAYETLRQQAMGTITPALPHQFHGGSQGAAVGPKIGDLISKYLAAKKSSWAPKTLDNRRHQLRYLVEHLGGDTPVSAVQTQDIGKFRDGVLRLRVNHHVGAGKSFLARQTENEDHRIQPKTAWLLLDATKSFFLWAKGEGYIEKNPAETIRIVLPKQIKVEKPRAPFTADHLTRIFSSPPFTGARGLKQRFMAGDIVISVSTGVQD